MSKKKPIIPFRKLSVDRSSFLPSIRETIDEQDSHNSSISIESESSLSSLEHPPTEKKK